MRQTTELRSYQPKAIDLMVQKRRCAVLLKPGLGKTICTLMALMLLHARRTLIVAPAQVVHAGVWSKEALAWAATCGLRVIELTAGADRRALELMLGADVYVVSYENLLWLTDQVPRGFFDAIVYDELSMMKHPGTRRFKRMRAWAKDIPIRFGLTGSPLGNHWLDLWGELYIIHGDAPLGPTFGQYQSTYFTPIPNTWQWKLRQDGSDEIIRQRIKGFAFSIDAKLAAAELPEIAYSLRKLEIPEHCREQEARLRRELEIQLDSGTTLTALNNSKLAMTIRQFASGAVYTGLPGDSSQWEVLHGTKINALGELLDEQQGDPLLIYIWFKHEAARIRAAFPQVEILEPGDANQMARWNRREIPGLLSHPQSKGRGLNLQYGSSSVCWHTLPWSRELFDQGNGRVARIGQPDPFVTATALLAGPIDRRVWSALMSKGEAEDSVMDAVAI